MHSAVIRRPLGLLRVWEDARMGFAFISYSRMDASYVERLAVELSRRHLEFWYDRRIDSGDRWTQAIETKVRGCAVFVPVVTPDSVASEWCERELHLAIGWASRWRRSSSTVPCRSF